MASFVKVLYANYRLGWNHYEAVFQDKKLCKINVWELIIFSFLKFYLLLFARVHNFSENFRFAYCLTNKEAIFRKWTVKIKNYLCEGKSEALETGEHQNFFWKNNRSKLIKKSKYLNSQFSSYCSWQFNCGIAHDVLQPVIIDNTFLRGNGGFLLVTDECFCCPLGACRNSPWLQMNYYVTKI